MSFNHYYLDELAALKKLGQSFAEENPALAPFLSEHSQDPDVARLFEGFAFLTGRLRQKLDDELPELTHSLMRLLWPNYVRPVPGLTTVEFTPKPELSQSQVIKRKTELKSQPIDGVKCIFSTCFETRIFPLGLSHTHYASSGEGGVFSVRLEVLNGADFSQMTLDQLRLHLAGDKSTCLSLLLAMLEHCTQVEIKLQDAELNALEKQTIPGDAIKSVGFAPDEGLLDYPLNSFLGYRHIQEFFCYPEKFQYLDITQLPQWREDSAKQTQYIEFSFYLSRMPIAHFRKENLQIKLFCTPVVNIFDTDASPILLDNQQEEYPLLLADLNEDQGAILAVNRVRGWQPGRAEAIRFHDFESFEHNGSKQLNFYSIKQAPNIRSNRVDSFLSFNHNANTRTSTTVSVEVQACHGHLPKGLALRSITEATDTSPEYASFENIRGVTAMYAPPLDKGGLWSLISNMSLNYISLSDVAALRRVLEAYDFPGYHDDTKARQTKRLLDGILTLEAGHLDLLMKGLPVRGAHTQLTLDTRHFLCEGELYLFASVLNEFFSLYASINSFHQLNVSSTEGSKYQWTPKLGQQPVI